MRWVSGWANTERRFFMLDFSKVLAKFCQIAHADDNCLGDAVPIIQDSIFELEELIDDEKFSPEMADKCEYAAAAMAFYDYVCIGGAREKIIVSLWGKAESSEDFSNREKYAKKVKDNAVRAIRNITKDNEFLFKAI